MNVPFRPVWIGGNIGPCRVCDSTYNEYDLHTLPPLDGSRFDGSFEWLQEEPPPRIFDERFRGFYSLDAWRAGVKRRKPALLDSSRALRVSIPEELFTFLDDVELVSRFRSPTDCEFLYPSEVITHPEAVAGAFIHFCRDSQDCFQWYLYIEHARSFVVATSESLDELEPDHQFWSRMDDKMACCATSFEEFLCRLWLENEIYHRLTHSIPPLTREMRRYIQFYESHFGS